MDRACAYCRAPSPCRMCRLRGITASCRALRNDAALRPNLMGHSLSLRTVIQSDAWRVALEKYGGGRGTTVAVYAAPAIPVLGPVPSPPPFATLNVGAEGPGKFPRWRFGLLRGKT